MNLKKPISQDGSQKNKTWMGMQVKFSQFVPEGQAIVFNNNNPCGEISLGTQSTVFLHTAFLERVKPENILKRANRWVQENR